MHVEQPIADLPQAAEVRPTHTAPSAGPTSERLRAGHIGHELASLATAAAAMHLAEQIRRSLLGEHASANPADHRAAITPPRAPHAADTHP